MSIATAATIRRVTVDALSTLPGLAVKCTAFRAPDNDGYAVVAFHAGVVTVLQITGSDAVQGALVLHALSELRADILVIAPRASAVMPGGACVALGAA